MASSSALVHVNPDDARPQSSDVMSNVIYVTVPPASARPQLQPDSQHPFVVLVLGILFALHILFGLASGILQLGRISSPVDVLIVVTAARLERFRVVGGGVVYM